MKKLHLTIFPGNFLPHVGGLETHVDEFAKYYSQYNKNAKITIFTPNVMKEGKFREMRYKNVEVIRYPAFEIVHNFPFPNIVHPRYWQAIWLLYTRKTDIVMTRTRFFINTFAGFKFAKFRFNPKPLMHVEHGSSFVELSSPLKTKLALYYDRVFGGVVFKCSNSVITISTAVDTFVKKAFKVPKKKITLIRRGLDFEVRSKAKVNKKLRDEFKSKVILCSASRLYKWKGLDKAIKAFKALPDSVRSKAVFVLVGDGEDYDHLKKLAGSELNKSIFLKGRLPHKEAFSVLKTADVYVHTSNPGGGLSSAVLDAMYFECAILASPHEGAKEVFYGKNSALLLDTNSVDHIKDAMHELITKPKLRKSLSKAAKAQVMKDFDWKKTVVDYNNVFEDLLEKR